jgi:hypothetical protein
MPDWRIYYDDYSTFDSDQGEPHEAPPVGFIVAVAYDEAGDRFLMHGWSHYCFDKASFQWWGMDDMGVFDRLRRNLVYAYKEGRTVTKSEWNAIMERAHKDPDFPFGAKR